MKTYTYIDASEYSTLALCNEQIAYIDGLLCEMEEESKALLASNDRDDFAKFCNHADDMNDLYDQMLELNALALTLS